MFTIKHVFDNGENYHCFSATSYFVDYSPPPGVLKGSVSDEQNARMHFATQIRAGWIFPRITMTLSDRSEEAVDVSGVAYVTNAAGKTIDVIRPTMEPASGGGQAPSRG
jgi:hypothetical protein